MMPVIAKQDLDVAIFDLDGVVTNTAKTHATAWKRLFDDFLRERDGPDFVPFDIERDYYEFVDGRPRYDGVRAFFESRDIALPDGEPSDPPGAHTICGLGNAKNAQFQAAIAEDGVAVFEDALALIRRLKSVGIEIAVVTASKNCDSILRAAELEETFDVRVDGVDIEDLGMAGKPAPDSFLEAARRLAADPRHCVVFEDAYAGVEAGRAGGFGFVVGVDRHGDPQAFLDHGADVAVEDLNTVEVAGLPDALDRRGEIIARLRAGNGVVCLDYDGTLTGIVSRPEEAVLGEPMRAALANLASVCAVAIASGRDLESVKALVGLDLIYIANHGFQMALPDGTVEAHRPAEALTSRIEQVGRDARDRLGSVPGVLIESKPFSVAVHDRLVPEEHRDTVRRAVDDLLGEHPELRLVEGKRVREFRPDIDWDKGTAVEKLAGRLGVPLERVLYIGDDMTDEDVFRALRGRGMGVVVWDGPRRTAAAYCLSGIQEVERLLRDLAKELGRDDGE